MPATLYACTLVEKAIKEKCERSAIALKGNQDLRKRMWLTVDRGWLTNADFKFAIKAARLETAPSADPDHPPTVHSTPRYAPTDTDYCEHLAEWLPRHRNFGAYGEAGLGFPSAALGIIDARMSRPRC